MGIFASCLKGSNDDVPSSTGPDAVLKRQQMAEAAEKRLKEQESRGVKDPEKLRRQQQRQAELDRELGAAERSPNDANLRWQVT
uniref:Small VCP/p97-interacting protein n=1 Tax=Ixodes ricinus TaxID=34613 RepID=V5HRS0_IXORI